MITAVITTHKREYPVVLRAVHSILAQTYPDIQVLVVDDSPADFAGRKDVRQAVETVGDARVQYIPHDTCQGACAARNTGLRHALGEYIAFLDDDDEWMPHKLEKQLAVFQAGDQEDLALVYCQFAFYNETDQTEHIPTAMFTGFQRGRVFDSLIQYNYIASTSFPLIKTAALREIGGFDEAMLSCQDYDVWLRLAERFTVDYVAEPLVRFHIHADESIGKNPTKRIQGQERLYHKNEAYLKTHKQAAWARLQMMAPMYATVKNGKKTIWAIAKMIGCRPLAVNGNLTTALKAVRNLFS